MAEATRRISAREALLRPSSAPPLAERAERQLGNHRQLAETIAKNRTPLPREHPLLEQELQAIGQMSDNIERANQYRDAAEEQTFRLLYGS